MCVNSRPLTRVWCMMCVGLTEVAVMSLLSHLVDVDGRYSFVYAATQVAVSFALVVGLRFAHLNTPSPLRLTSH